MAKRFVVAVAVAAVALAACARSITGASFTQAGATTTVSVTFEAGSVGDDHALYVAYDVQDRGATLAGWAAYQRIGRVAADATSATFTLLPALTGRGYGICRVFLVESTYPFDTLIEAIRQTGTQYIDTGINAGPTTFTSVDFQFDSVATKQQRIFGVASDDGTSVFSFDTYINGSGQWASACRDGSGDWTASNWAASPVRLTMSLDAATGLHLISNRVTHAVTTVSHAKSTRTETAVGAITIFARRSFVSGVPKIHLFAEGGLIYGAVISNENTLARCYLPCESNGRAGLYDTVSGTIFWSAAENTDFLVAGDCVPCAPAAGETLLSGSDALDLLNSSSGTFWKGSASGNWNGTDANWTVDGVPGQVWTDGSDATFNDSATTRTVTIPSGTAVTPASVTFHHAQDYTLGGDGGIAGTGTFVKSGNGTLTISGINNSFTGDVLLAGGTTVLTGEKDTSNITSGALGNPRVPRTVTVSNATLRVTGKNPFGGGGRSSTPILAAVKLYNATLDLPTDFAFNMGDVYLHDSVVNFHFGLVTGTHWGSIAAENLYFSGTSPMTFIADENLSVANQQKVGLLLGKFAQATIDVPDITANSYVDAFIKMPIFRATANDTDPGYPSGFRKTGAGTLELGGRDWQVGSRFSDYVGDVDIEQGTLRMTNGGADYGASHASAFGLTSVPHTFTVHPGATLQLATSDLQGQVFSTNVITLRVNGGKLEQTAGFVNGLGRLILENATLTYKGIAVQNYYAANGAETNLVPVIWPTLSFNGGVEFRGTNAYVLANGVDDNGNHARLFFGTADGKPSDIFVDEITGRGTPDETTDVTINARLQDAPAWYKYTSDANNRRIISGYNYNLKGLPLNMRKTGPGILVLNSKLSTTTGRIEVVEGTLKMGGGMGSSEANFECPTNTYLGDLRDPNRVALVLNGGTLWITSNDTFGQANTVNRSLFAVTNGTIRTTATSCTAFPALDLYDATLNYSGANSGNGGDISAAHPWGTYIFAQRVHFDGTRPYDLQDVGGVCYFSLGWQSDSYRVPNGNYTEQHGKTEFCVEDITANADVDVTIGVVLKYPDRWNGRTDPVTNKLYSTTNFRTGLLKTGPGTLRLNNGSIARKYYAEATRVNGGTLLVDAATFNSTNVFVQAGAYLGGTGTVARATIEAGGGFTAAPDQTRPLTLTAATLPANGEVTLDVPYVGSIDDLNSVRVPVVTANALAGAKWRVTLNGAAVPSGYTGTATVYDGVVYASVARGGTYLIIR